MKENKMLSNNETKKVYGGVGENNFHKMHYGKLSSFIKKMKDKNKRIKSRFINNSIKPLNMNEVEKISGGVNHESKSEIFERLRNPFVNISAPTKICGKPIPDEEQN